ncbi:MAG: hypothetical protein IPJ31_10980 [Bacteroidetes bacterium]|nr:hypothetical protein [Bacteroidota bacterium]
MKGEPVQLNLSILVNGFLKRNGSYPFEEDKIKKLLEEIIFTRLLLLFCAY